MDTSFEIDAMQADIHRRLGGSGRAQLALEMSMAAREFAWARLRMSHPEYSHSEIVHAYLRELYGRENYPAGP